MSTEKSLAPEMIEAGQHSSNASVDAADRVATHGTETDHVREDAIGEYANEFDQHWVLTEELHRWECIRTSSRLL